MGLVNMNWFRNLMLALLWGYAALGLGYFIHKYMRWGNDEES